MKFLAFGLVIESEIHLNAPEVNGVPDVFVYFEENLDVESQNNSSEWIVATYDEAKISVYGYVDFVVRNGKEIFVSSLPDTDIELVKAYLFGAVFAFLLQQRGIITIHGSCLYKDGKTLLVCGDSGAGKSTISGAFINEGWKLMSDDLVPVIENDGVYFVRSSFPCQKMWQDTVRKTGSENRIIAEIHRSLGGVKYQIDASDRFIDTILPLDYGVMLTKGSDELILREVIGFPKVDLLMKNRFIRRFVPDKRCRTEQFNVCIGLANQVRLFLAERPCEGDTVNEIVNYLTEQTINCKGD